MFSTSYKFRVQSSLAEAPRRKNTCSEWLICSYVDLHFAGPQVPGGPPPDPGVLTDSGSPRRLTPSRDNPPEDSAHPAGRRGVREALHVEGLLPNRPSQ
ncbi:hypothetical protein CDAR_392941, partial [Caerostris darwini]